MIQQTTRQNNLEGIHQKIGRIWQNVERLARKYNHDIEKDTKIGSPRIWNNDAWLKNLNLLSFLNNMGHALRLGPMLSRDTVKLKMEQGDGMSFAEFCYPLIQAWDWWHLYNLNQPDESMVQIQIGGSDQFGNLIAGMDAVKSMLRSKHNGREEAETEPPIGFTVPLLTTSSGAKFGKSAGNAVWLGAELTKHFDLYGFFVSTADADVERLLRFFTFMPLSDITALVEEHMEHPELRIAQHRLAHEVLSLVYGDMAADKIQIEHRTVFRQKKASSLEWDPSEADATMSSANVVGVPLSKVLASSGIIGHKSRTMASNMIESGAVYLATDKDGANFVQLGNKNTPETARNPVVKEDWIQDGGCLRFRIGKKHIRSIHVTDA